MLLIKWFFSAFPLTVGGQEIKSKNDNVFTTVLLLFVVVVVGVVGVVVVGILFGVFDIWTERRRKRGK